MTWLTSALRRVSADHEAIKELFPQADRRCGREPLPGVPDLTAGQDARVRLMLALPLRGQALASVILDLYRRGDPAERLAVLLSLERLAAWRGLAAGGLPIVHDALRTNDVRLIGAALGPYAAGHLDADAYRQAVLKCVFVGIPLASVAGLERRADPELSRMLLDYAHERQVAGREVPSDLWPLALGTP